MDVVDEGHTVASSSDLIPDIQVLKAEGVLLGPRSFAVGAHDEENRVEREVVPVRVALQALKLITARRFALAEPERVRQVLDQHRAREMILVSVLLGHTTWNTEMLVFVEPQHVEVAAAFRQLGQEGLDGVDSVQQLESV